MKKRFFFCFTLLFSVYIIAQKSAEQPKTEQVFLATYVSEPVLKSLINYAHVLADHIRPVINKFLQANPTIKKEIASKKRKNIIVSEQKKFHYTHLFIGTFPVNKFDQLNKIILDALNNPANNVSSALTVKLFTHAKLMLLANNIVIKLSLEQVWRKFILDLIANLKNIVNIEASKQWLPHLTLDIITPREALQLKDSETEQSFKDSILEKLADLNKYIGSQPNVTFGNFALDELVLTHRASNGYNIVTKFKFDQSRKKWIISFPYQAQPDDLFSLTRALRQLANN